MQTLETIDAETCIFKIGANRAARPTTEQEHCIRCTKTYELECSRYKPMSRYNNESPVRRGTRAVIYA